jgi:hypothetical protein
MTDFFISLVLAACGVFFITAVLAQPVPTVPDEATKTRALKLGYALNGESMKRDLSLGSIDVRSLLLVPDASLIEPPRGEPEIIEVPTVTQPKK